MGPPQTHELVQPQPAGEVAHADEKHVHQPLADPPLHLHAQLQRPVQGVHDVDGQGVGTSPPFPHGIQPLPRLAHHFGQQVGVPPLLPQGGS